MRLLVISDIHSNLEALQACLEVAPEYDRVANLGDLIGYGASPNEVIETARELSGIVVRGNHDRACSGLIDIRNFNPIAGTAALWTRSMLHAENLLWIRKLPQGPLRSEDLPGVQFVHGSPMDEDEYIMNSLAARDALDLVDTPITFFGHTHIQGGAALTNRDLLAVTLQWESRKTLEQYTVQIDGAARYLINPGSVGQPRDGDWRAGFAVYDSDAATVTFYRVPYPIDLAQHRIIAANLPPRLASRLREGR
ncbi:MAG TPA: metallophosphoesterase family protein [Clostridia bacterium]|nr:metallophosphoesterase family protein [Clostridia bacterium]